MQRALRVFVLFFNKIPRKITLFCLSEKEEFFSKLFQFALLGWKVGICFLFVIKVKLLNNKIHNILILRTKVKF